MNEEAIEEFLKSQLRNGQYTPANRLTDLGREKQREHLKNGGGAGKFRGNQDPVAGRGLASVYSMHAVDAGIEDAVKAPTRPSKVHRNIEYGDSITPEMERVVDREVDPKVVGGAKHKIVYHHGPADDDIVAGATGSHVTTGGKAHVIINRSLVSSSGQMSSLVPVHFGEILNHETAHALKHNKNPRTYFDHKGDIKGVRSLGEEARADAIGIKGPGLYARNGVVVHPHQMKAAEKGARDAGVPEKQIANAVAGHKNYWDVHHAVQHSPSGRGLTAPGMPHVPHAPTRGFPKLPPIGAMNREELMWVGAAAVGGAIGGAYGAHRKRQQLKQSGKWDETKHRRNRGKFAPKGAAVEKRFDRVKTKLDSSADSLKITSEQARSAGALGQVGGATGGVLGTAIGAGIGAAAKHPAQGAGLGAAVGSALGGGGGAAAGLYAARPRKKKTAPKYDTLAMHRPPADHPPLVKPKKPQVSKAYDETLHRRDTGGRFSQKTGMTEVPGSGGLSEQNKTRLARAGLFTATAADLAGAKAAYREGKGAVRPVTTGLSRAKKVGAIADYAGKKAALPIVAAGVGATLLADRQLRHKENAVTKRQFDSAEEVFGKARGEVSKDFDENKHHRNHGMFAAGAGALGAGGIGAGHALGRLSQQSANEASSFASRARIHGQGAQYLGAQARHDLTPTWAGRPDYQRGIEGADRARAEAGQARNYRGLARSATQDAKVLGRAGTSAKVVGGAAASAAFVEGAKALHHHLHGSSDVEKLFTEARVSKLERETKHGLKVGGLTGGGIGAGMGAVGGAHLASEFGEAKALGAAGGATRGALRVGAVGGAIGAAVGAHKANKRIKKPVTPTP